MLEVDSRRPNQSLKVRDIFEGQFYRMKRETSVDPKTVVVHQEEWKETSDSNPIINVGACPCSIIYILDPLGELIVSGHFSGIPRTSSNDINSRYLSYMEKEFKESKPDSLLVPTGVDLERLSVTDPSTKNYSFLEMLSFVREFTKNDFSELEVYLFGQNFPNIAESIQDHLRNVTAIALEHLNLKTILNSAGVKLPNIYDYREIGTDRSEDTLYSPKTRTIYHHVQSNQKV